MITDPTKLGGLVIDALTEPLLMFPLTAEAAKAGRQEHFDILFFPLLFEE